MVLFLILHPLVGSYQAKSLSVSLSLSLSLSVSLFHTHTGPFKSPIFCTYIP